MEFSNLSWRFESEVASKSEKESFKPNIVLNFQFNNPQPDKEVNNVVNCDFANLKNLHETLS